MLHTIIRQNTCARRHKLRNFFWYACKLTERYNSACGWNEWHVVFCMGGTKMTGIMYH